MDSFFTNKILNIFENGRFAAGLSENRTFRKPDVWRLDVSVGRFKTGRLKPDVMKSDVFCGCPTQTDQSLQKQ